MLHSFHYYACYYALLCLLHHQQQAASSLTIIIDGATTNEWATRDEYARLVDGASASETSGQPLTATGTATTTAEVGNRQLGQQRRQQQQTVQEVNEQMEQEQQEELRSAASDFEAALDRLDLIEEQQRRVNQYNRQLKQQQQQLKQRHRQQVGDNHLPAIIAARTLSDLVPEVDENLDEPLRHLKERGSSPRIYCGKQLTAVLDLVCEGRFYSPGEPLIVNPTIKNKRFSGSYMSQIQQLDERFNKLAGGKDEEERQQQPVTQQRRRKLALETGDSTNNNHLISIGENDYTKSQDNDNPDINKETSHSNSHGKKPYLSSSSSSSSTKSLNRSGRLALYRQIRGASKECCDRPCTLDELKPYCKPPLSAA